MKNMKLRPIARIGALKKLAAVALALNAGWALGQSTWHSGSQTSFGKPGSYDTKIVKVECWGAGGGGSNGQSAWIPGHARDIMGGTGGGGGAFAGANVANYLPVNATVNITYGKGGAGTSTLRANGSNGTDTYVSYNGTEFMRAYAGKAGQWSRNGNLAGDGGSGGTFLNDSRITNRITNAGGRGGNGTSYGSVGYSGGGGGAAGANANEVGYNGDNAHGSAFNFGNGGRSNTWSSNPGNDQGYGAGGANGLSGVESAGQYGGGGAGNCNAAWSSDASGTGAGGGVRITYYEWNPGAIATTGQTLSACTSVETISSSAAAKYVTGNATVSYRWKCNGTVISGATGASYTPGTEYTSVAGTYTFTREAKDANYFDWTPSTGSWTLTVQTGTEPKVVLNDMTNETIASGESTTLTASASESYGTVTYSWSPATGLNTTTGATVTATPTATTVYTVTATATSGSCTATDSKQVTVTVSSSAVDAPVVICPTIDPFACKNDVPAAYDSYTAFVNAGGTVTCSIAIDESSFRLVSSVTEGDEPCDYTITRTYGIKNTNDEEGTGIQTITVKDNVAPGILPGSIWPANIEHVEDCYNADYANQLASNDVIKALFTDCEEVSVVSTDAIVDDNCEWSIVRTYTITDACGNTYYTDGTSTLPTQSISGGDVKAPVMRGIWPENITGINACYDASLADQLKSNDEVKSYYNDCGTITVTSEDEVVSTSNKGWQIKRTYTITDGCNTVTPAPIFSISGADKTAPVLKDADSWPEDVEQNACIADADITVLKSDAEIKDLYEDCDDIIVLHLDDTAFTSECEWTITRTYAISDVNLNAVTPAPTMKIIGSDKTAPVLSGTWTSELPDVIDACMDDATATGLLDEEGAAALFTDCDTVIVSFTEDIAGDDCEWTITRTYTVKDRCDNLYDNGTEPLTMTVKGGDKTAPVVTAPKDTTIYKDNNCEADTIPATTGVAIVTDRCDANPAVSYINVDITPDNACEGTLIIKRRWTAEDVCGNKADTVDQIITVLDTIRPTFTVPNDTTIFKDENCDYDASPEITGKISNVWDNCSTKFDTTYVDKDVTDRYYSCEGHLVIERTWRLVDNCGNISLSDSIQIIAVRDSIRPTFTAPKDTTIYKDENCEYDITVENVGDVLDEADNCTSVLEATYRDSIITPEDACEGLLVIQRIWSLVDDCGNEAIEQNQIITIKDSLAPTFTVPADIVLCRDENRKIAADTTVTGKPTDISDNCSEVTISFTDIDTTGTDNEYRIITRVWEAKDACENVAVDTQRITIAPAISEDNFRFECPASDTTLYLFYSACDTLVVFDTLAYTCDIANVNVTLTNNQPASKRLGVGDNEIIWTATDSCGFTVQCSFVLHILYPPCGTADSVVLAKDEEGNEYKTIRVGCDCWLAENLKSSAEKAVAYQNDAANEENYGKLYSWYSTVKVAEGDNNSLPEATTVPATRSRSRAAVAAPGSLFVQGVCPQGWAVPTMEDYSRLVSNAGGISKIKSPDQAYWLPGSEGDSEGSSLFEARGAGYCNFDTQEFFNLKGTTGFWTCDSKANASTASVFKISYICNDAIPEDNSKNIGYSVRCIRKY